MQQYLFFQKGHLAEMQGHHVQYSQEQDVYYFMFVMLPQHIGENYRHSNNESTKDNIYTRTITLSILCFVFSRAYSNSFS